MKTTGKGFCIAALILAALGAVVPVVGLFVGWAALGLATIGALAGNKGRTIAVVALSAVVFLTMTPSLWIETAGHSAGYGRATGSAPILQIITFVMLAAPIVGMIVSSKKKEVSE
jgi:uncharacterized membrane protein YkgB